MSLLDHIVFIYTREIFSLNKCLAEIRDPVHDFKFTLVHSKTVIVTDHCSAKTDYMPVIHVDIKLFF